MKKFKNAHGTVYAPHSEAVEAMMLNDARFTVVEDTPAKKTARKPAARKTAAKTDAEAADTEAADTKATE